MQIVAVAINVPLRKLFFYTINQDTQFENIEHNQLIGSRVKVSFGKSNKEVIGFILMKNTTIAS